MIIGDHEFPPDKALGILSDYAVHYASTVGLYDLAGDPDGYPGPGSGAEPVNAVSLSDVGRLVVINAGLAADDVATIMNIDAASEFTAVPARAHLEDCDQLATYTRHRLLYMRSTDSSAAATSGQRSAPNCCTLNGPGLCPSPTAAPSAFTAAAPRPGLPGSARPVATGRPYARISSPTPTTSSGSPGDCPKTKDRNYSDSAD
jgi:hypothetical protein